MSAQAISQSDLISPILNTLSPKNRGRLTAMISAPFFLLMIISNVFFLSNVPIGMQFIFRFLAIPLSFPIPFIPTILIMMCGCVVSMDYVRREKERTS